MPDLYFPYWRNVPNNHHDGCKRDMLTLKAGELYCVPCGIVIPTEIWVDGYNAESGASDDPPWIKSALSMKGIKEIAGEQDNPDIVMFHQTTTLKATDDETPWCASFVNWCFTVNGIRGTDSAHSKSWLSWGRKLDTLEDWTVGDVAVFQRSGNTSYLSGGGHVGFIVGIEGDHALVLGGNQSNTVKVSKYPLDSLLEIVRYDAPLP